MGSSCRGMVVGKLSLGNALGEGGEGGKAPNYLVTIYTSNSAYEDYIDSK